MREQDLVDRYRGTDGDGFGLKRFHPAETCGLDLNKHEAKELLATGTKRLRDVQERLYAEKQGSLLIVLQAIDTAGKDGTIEHAMSGVNPWGCIVYSTRRASPICDTISSGAPPRQPEIRIPRKVPKEARTSAH